MQHGHPKTLIKYLVFMGDSLSDRDTFARREIAYGLIPNNLIVDLSKSPHGRFTNGFTWDDYLCEALVSRYLSKEIENQKHIRPDDLADAVIDHDPSVEPRVQAEQTLNNDREVDLEGRRVARTCCEGGLTAHDYSSSWVPSFTLMFARKIVATLEKKRELLLADDKKLAVKKDEKKQTLVIEWSGANDLITVNAEPTEKEADLAIAARMENIRQLYEAGYRNFALLNIPDLSCTPRFQAMEKSAQENASKVCSYFNDKLAKAMNELKADQKYNELSINLFDVNSAFKEIYDNPERYGFDSKKKYQAYNASNDFVMHPNHTSPAPGYLFWDDIHPTATAHHKLSVIITDQFTEKYKFTAPPEHKADAKRMFEKFINKYLKKVKADKSSIWSGYGATTYDLLPKELTTGIENTDDYIPLIAKILYHGLNENGKRTRSILLEMGWIDDKNNILANNHALMQAKEQYDFMIGKRPTI